MGYDKECPSTTSSHPPSHNNRDVDGYICMYLFVCVWEGRDKEKDAFWVSLVTLFQHVIHADECIKQSLWNSEFCLHSGDRRMVEMDSGEVLNVALGSGLGSLEA